MVLINKIFMAFSTNESSEWSGLRMVLCVALGAAAVFYFVLSGVHAWRQTLEVGRPTPYEHSIYIEGKAKISAVPTVASLTIGVNTEGETASLAESENSETMRKITEGIKALGILADDIKSSSYSSYPKRVWNPDLGKDEQDGWIVDHQLTVKVRDTAKVSEVFRVANELGATNTFGPNFSIDDEETLKASARAEALANARAQAEELASSLGLAYDGVIGYSEYLSGGDYAVPYYSAEGRGGAAPEILPGQEERTLVVTLTLKLRE